jgi:hypothetical protein
MRPAAQTSRCKTETSGFLSPVRHCALLTRWYRRTSESVLLLLLLLLLRLRLRWRTPDCVFRSPCAACSATIGANTVMELDFAIDRTGNVAPDHAALYKAFGDWRRACYDTPLASAQLPIGASTVTLQLAPSGSAGVPFDRVVLQEALSGGQCVSNYSLEVQLGGGGGTWTAFGQTGAHLIGNKRIELGGSGPGVLGPTLNATAVRFNVTATFWASSGGCQPDVTVSAYAPGPCVPVPPPLPPPKSRVKFVFSANGLCLVTNTTLPCQA